MAKKKKEKKVLETKSGKKEESIQVSFGDIEAKLNIEDGKLVGISLYDISTFMRHFCIFDNEIEEAVAIFKKIIVLNDAMNVLQGDNDG